MEIAKSKAQPSPGGGVSTRRILFIPVTGPKGVGEYHRSLFLAEALMARHANWDIRMVIAKTAPFVDEVPVPIFRTSRSPTLEAEELAVILEEFRPHVAVFDCSGRKRSFRLARRLGAKTIFISNHKRKRSKGFQVLRMRVTDDHWIMQPAFLGTQLKLTERLKLGWLNLPLPVFLGPVFPEPEPSPHIPFEKYFLACPGGGGNPMNVGNSGNEYMNAAKEIADSLNITGVVIAGQNFEGELIADPKLQVHRSLPGHELAGLLAGAQFALVGGGDLLAQAVANCTPSVAAPSAPDQPQRIAQYEQAGLCLSSAANKMAETVTSAYRDGRLKFLAQRLDESVPDNGLETGVQRIETLAGTAR